ncbi:MAG: hypothetical protein KJO59_07155 [Ignavibacteria bacterium]|nr:hypothetical protein [Ignavibacteria bacterium]
MLIPGGGIYVEGDVGDYLIPGGGIVIVSPGSEHTFPHGVITDPASGKEHTLPDGVFTSAFTVPDVSEIPVVTLQSAAQIPGYRALNRLKVAVNPFSELIRAPQLLNLKKKSDGLVKVNWNNSITRGITMLHYPIKSGSLDLVTNTLYKPTDIEVINGAGVGGTSIKSGKIGGLSSQGIQETKEIWGGLTEASITIVLSVTEIGTEPGVNYFYQSKRIRLSGSSGIDDIYFQIFDSAVDGTARKITATYAYPKKEVIVITARWKGHATASESEIWVNGSKLSATVNVDTHFTNIYSSGTYSYDYAEGQAVGSSGFSHDHYMGVFHNRYLTDGEIISLHKDPYQFLDPV